MEAVVLVTDHWPLVYSRLPARVDVDTIDVYLGRFEREVLRRAEPFTTVFDMTPLSHLPGARTRQRAVEWSQEFEAPGLLWNRGTAMVTPNPITRALMTSLHWLVPPKVPTSYQPDLSHAVRWTFDRMATSGMSPPHIQLVLADLASR